jgi:hypothetical protein
VRPAFDDLFLSRSTTPNIRPDLLIVLAEKFDIESPLQHVPVGCRDLNDWFRAAIGCATDRSGRLLPDHGPLPVVHRANSRTV